MRDRIKSKLLLFLYISSIVFIFISTRSALAQSGGIQKVTWLKDGLIMAGTQEPLIFRLRRGGDLTVDAEKEYGKEYSEENVKKLASLGVTVFHTNLYKGFGMEAERDEMEMIKNFSKIVHKYSMRMSTYIQWNTLMYETFFNEVPEAKNWVQVDQNGNPILIYGNNQTFRYAPCFNNPAYRTYFKKILKFAVEEAKTDFIHFDNFMLRTDPESCHCTVCQIQFRDYLSKKYDAKTLKSRFGFTDLDHIIPPKVDPWQVPWSWKTIDDPLMQEWCDFKCKSMGSDLQEMALYIKSLNPEVVVETNPNPYAITGLNNAMGGIDYPQLFSSTEAFWTEESNDPKLTSDGRLSSTIRSYKLARAFDQILLSYWHDSTPTFTELQLFYALDLAFNQTIGYLGGISLSPAALKYLAFYKQNRSMYIGTKDVANVAILRSYASMAYNGVASHLSTILFEQSLIQAKVPFDIIFDCHLQDLKKYRVIILADQECLSDAQLNLLKNYVRDGGGVVLTEKTSSQNEWLRQRPNPGLADLLSGTEYLFSKDEKRNVYGKGRAVYIPEIIPSVPLPPQMSNVPTKYWYLPKNWAQLISAVQWACNDDIPISVKAPLTVVLNLVKKEKENKLMIHLLNFDLNNPVQSIPVSLAAFSKAAVQKISIISPDNPKISEVTFKQDAGHISFTIPELKIYDVILIE